jgi:hypothetical protein
MYYIFPYLRLGYGYSPQRNPTNCGYFNPELFINAIVAKDLSGEHSIGQLPQESIDGSNGEYGIVGFGYAIVPTDASTPNPPDFIVRKTWLVNTSGAEIYKYGIGDSFQTKAQSKNIGSGSCSGDITGHFYLSKGYKEDAHSGDGAWRRISSTNTHCSSLDPSETHTETESFVVSQWITAPGVYNIVYCIDHPKDDHNNGGDYPEEHESNNCSTEAVFTVESVSATPTIASPQRLRSLY